MKQKLTILLFSLLLAVGWTSNAFAQSATYKAEDIKTWTYGWRNANGDSIDSKYIDEVTDPYQMYGLLRWIYMDKRFPGPYKSAYTKDGVRERDVYYGGMDGGWEIPGTPTTNITTVQVPNYNDIVITTTTSYVSLVSIHVFADGIELEGWATSSSQPALPSDWTPSKTVNYNSEDYDYSIYMSSGGTITIPASLIQGKSNVQVRVSARKDATNSSGYVRINGTSVGTLYTTATMYSQSVTPASYTSQKSTNVSTIGDIYIGGYNNNAAMTSITITSGSNTLFSWSYANDGRTFPLGMHHNGYSYNATAGWIAVQGSLKPFYLDGWLFTNQDNVQVTITAWNRGSETASVLVNGVEKTISTSYSSTSNQQTLTWTVSKKAFNGPVEYQANTYLPNEEGYTALVVKLKNKLTLAPEENDWSIFNTKEEIIDYLSKNVRSIQLLTDGLRIGYGENVGTVFNCPGESDYNRFFFLGKGQARQKTDVVRTMQTYQEKLVAERVPFRQMFEQFSPTSGEKGSDVKDFYSKMMKGEVFPVIHDCLSVMQNQHEFSMSGHDGSTAYAMPGMNFFIPDYRLKFWSNQYTMKTYTVNSETGDTTWTVVGTYTVDGRIMNPIQEVDLTTGNVAYDHSRQFYKGREATVWYAQYDTAEHAPVVGIYLLSLTAQASKVDGYSEPDNRYYNVDLNWTSSLNEMAGPDPVTGKGVKQTYIIYEVVTDSVTGERHRVAIDTVKNCEDFRPHLRLDTLYKQRAHSYTLTYIIEGSPVDSDHPEFVGWSREASVIIPGYDDFMILNLHHYESDFVIRKAGDEDYNAENGEYDEKNYYRNYLQPENDFVNGITAEDILGGYDSFILYRTSTDGKVPVAKLKLAVDGNGKVLYKITYFDDNENYNSPNFSNAEIQSVINQLLNNQ